MIKVIFPSAKAIKKTYQESEDIGQIPAIIYPIDQKRMIDVFQDHYFNDNKGITSFEVIAYEAYETVHKKLGNMSRVHLHKLDKLLSLGYSVYKGLEEIEPFEDDSIIINFADVVVFDQIPEILPDRIYYANEEVSSKWTFFTEENGTINKIYDKLRDTTVIHTNRIFIGIIYIREACLFRDILKKQLEKEGTIDPLWLALQEYSHKNSFEMICPDEWFDIGHIDKYFDTQIAVKSRSFNHIIIDRNRGTLTKTSENKEKLINEIRWYLKLPSEIEYLRPRIYEYSLDFEEPSVTMEYYAYRTIHELFLYCDLTREQWKNIFRRIRFIYNDMQRFEVRGEGVALSLKEIYVDKTFQRLERWTAENTFFVDRSFQINGVKYKSFSEIRGLLKEAAENLLCNEKVFHIIHGDLCFSNILIDSNFTFIKVIDPRGQFGKFDIYGDSRYELAKLMHSVEGRYDYIIKDLFYLENDDGKIEYNIMDDQGTEILRCFYDIFEEEMEKEERELRLIEALLFFSMLPLHEESKRQQLAMFITGIELTDKVLDIRL